jgi:PAS domain S-box-containing protein
MKLFVLSVRLIFVCVLLIGHPGLVFALEAPLTLGVLAFRSLPETLERWQPLADYLSRSLGDRPVELIAGGYPDLEQIISRNELDFVLTNPSHFIELRSSNYLSGALATMIVEEQGYAVTGFGGVVVTRSDRDDLVDLRDLRGKTIAAVSDSSLGGYRAQAMTLIQRGVRLPQDVRLLLTGMPHDNAVVAVLEGAADAGFTRTGVIEEMVAEGRLDAAQIKVLEPLVVPGFPFALSTRQYPEWPFVALAQVDAQVARKVAAALYLFEPDAATAARMGVVGFGIPADYEAVESLARTLRLPPYDELPAFGPADVWHQYRWQIVAGTLALLIMAGLVLLAALINRRLNMAKKLLDKERTRLAGIIEGTDVGTWEWNVQTGETTFNERWAEIIGYSLAELEPISIATWMKHSHPDDLRKSEELLSQYFNGEVDHYDFECRMRHKNGDWLWVLDRGKVISRASDGRPLMMMGTHLDITERKTATLALQQKNIEMEEFVYIVSHDLKSPLITMKSFLHMLRGDLVTASMEQVNEDIAYMEGAADKMDQLLGALLEYSRVGGTEGQKTRVDFSAVVSACVATLAGPLRTRAVEVASRPAQLTLHGDQMHLEQIWQNLIENAIKYMGDQPQPLVEIGVQELSGEIRFYVRDNGMGIEPEHQQRIFVMFNQLQRGGEGVGLGLALVKKIVESYQGRIWVESAGRDHGSCFWFTLPQAVGAGGLLDSGSGEGTT